MRLPGAPGPHQPRARLSRSADFDRVFRDGRSHAGREFVLYVFPRRQDEAPRLGLSVSRKIGGAVERNRIKRLLREAFAAESARLPAGTDAVILARRDAKALAEREGVAGVRAAVAELLTRACDSHTRREAPTGLRREVSTAEAGQPRSLGVWGGVDPKTAAADTLPREDRRSSGERGAGS